jgi:hypothetical protein
MTAKPAHECGLERLGALPRLTPDAAHTARVRGRCRVRLQRSRMRADGLRVLRENLRLVALGLVGGVCAVYLLLFVAFTLHWRG